MPEDFEFIYADVGVLVPSTFEEEREERRGSRITPSAL